MTLYRALAQLGRLIVEFAEREMERRLDHPPHVLDQIEAAWVPRTPKRS